MEKQTHKNISLHLKGLEDCNNKLKKAIMYADESMVAFDGVGILRGIRLAGNRKRGEYKVLSKILNPDDRDDLK